MSINGLKLQHETDENGIFLKTPDGLPVIVVGKVYGNTDLKVGYVPNGDEHKTLRAKGEK